MRRLTILIVTLICMPIPFSQADDVPFRFNIQDEVIIHPGETVPVKVGYQNLLTTERNFFISVETIDENLTAEGIPDSWTQVQPQVEGEIIFNLTAGSISYYPVLLLRLEITSMEDPNWIITKDIDVKISRQSNLVIAAQSGSSFYVQQNVNTTLAINVSNNAEFDDVATFSLNSSSSWEFGFIDDVNSEGLQVSSINKTQTIFVSFWIKTPPIENGMPIAGTGPRFTLSAQSQLDNEISTWSFDLEMQSFHDISIDSITDNLSLDPDDNGRIEITLRNNGNVNTFLDIGIKNSNEEKDRVEINGWKIALFNVFEAQELSPNQSRIIEVGFEAPNVDNSDVSVELIVMPQSFPQRQKIISLSSVITLERSGEITISTNECDLIAWNATCEQAVQITNTGNFYDEFYLTISNHSNMEFVIDSRIVTLSKGDTSEDIFLSLTPVEGITGLSQADAVIELRRIDGEILDSITILSAIEPHVDWIFSKADSELLDGNLSVTITLRNEGNVDDGLLVDMSSSYYTEVSLIPPSNSNYDVDAEKIRSFEILDIKRGDTFTFSGWAEVPEDQITSDDFYLNITVTSITDETKNFSYTVSATIGELPDSGKSGEGMTSKASEIIKSLLSNLWAWKWILIASIVSGLMINKSIKDQLARKNKSKIYQPKSTEENKPRDWMKDFERKEDEVPKSIESPTISSEEFSLRFVSNNQELNAETAKIDSAQIGSANDILSKSSQEKWNQKIEPLGKISEPTGRFQTQLGNKESTENVTSTKGDENKVSNETSISGFEDLDL